MTSQFYSRSHTLICTHPKTAFSAPHSTSSPHLAQTEQVRLTRFFALPDSNTSQRVTISVLGHVVVSRMGIVQVPYVTVTVKYLRALICRAKGVASCCNQCQRTNLLSVDSQRQRHKTRWVRRCWTISGGYSLYSFKTQVGLYSHGTPPTQH